MSRTIAMSKKWMGPRGQPTTIRGLQQEDIATFPRNSSARRQSFASPLAVLIVSSEGRLQSWNAGAEVLFGWSHEEDLGNSFFDYAASPDQSRLAGLLNAASEGGDLCCELTVLDRNRNRTALISTISPLPSPDGGKPQLCIVLQEEVRQDDWGSQELLHAFDRLREQGSLLEYANVMMIDDAERIVFWSKGDEEIYGYSQDEVIGKNVMKVLQTELPIPREEIYEIIDREGRWEGELIHTCRDGSQRILRSTWLRHYDRDDHAIGTVEFSSDITETRLAKQALEQSERDFRSYFELSGVGNAIMTPEDLRILKTNSQFREMIGYTEEELLERSCLDVTHPEDREVARQRWELALHQIEPHYRIEKRLVCKSGRVIWVNATATLLRDENGQPQKVLAVVRDVTDRHTAHEKLEAAREELEERVRERTSDLEDSNRALNEEIDRHITTGERLSSANRTLQTLIRESPLPMIAVDESQRILTWSTAAEELLGWTAKEAIGSTLTCCTGNAADGDVIATRLSSACSFQRETEVTTKSGDLKQILVISSPIYGVDQSLTGHVMLLEDIGEKKFLEAALLEASEREQRRLGRDLHDRLCQQLLGAAFSAHALSNSLEKKDAQSAGKLHELADFINEAVRQTREISRGLNPVELDAEGLMSALSELALLTDATIPCSFECPKPVPLRDTQSALHTYRIAQEAVAIILGSPEATRIVIRLTAPDGMVRLEITADGHDFMQQPEKSVSLGLRIMEYRAQAMGGSLKIGSDPDEGARIICTVPAAS